MARYRKANIFKNNIKGILIGFIGTLVILALVAAVCYSLGT